MNAVTVISALFALFVISVPVILSEFIGGWTAKYTSPRPIYSTSDKYDLTGQVAIVTGANTGIGYHTALELARYNATVIVAARNSKKGESAVQKIQKEISEDSSDKVIFLPLDLSSLLSVKKFAKKFKDLKLPLHVLVLNAGVMKSPGSQFVGRNFTYGFETTIDGFEMHIGVNHIAHFYLTELLQDKLVNSAPSRVVSVSSLAEEGAPQPDGLRFSSWKPKNGIPVDYEDGVAYGQSKLANIMFASELAKRLNGTGVTAYSCHPGVIMTELGRYMEDAMDAELSTKSWLVKILTASFGFWFQLSNFNAADGALTQLHLSVAETSTIVNGAFYHPVGRLIGSGRHPQGGNETLQKMAWSKTERIIREAGF